MTSSNSSDGQAGISSCPYECPSCAAVNDSMAGDWCSCVSNRPTLTCAACGGCFCNAPREWLLRFLTSPAAAAFRRRSSERARTHVPRALDLAPESVARPVILIVDDDKVVHLIAKRVLVGIAGTLIHAEDGEEGLRLALAVHPDVVITDALLPKLDGRELCRLLKTNRETRHCRVAVVTSLYKGLRYRAEAFKRFLVDEYAEKPLSPDALLRIALSLLQPARTAVATSVTAIGAAA